MTDFETHISEQNYRHTLQVARKAGHKVMAAVSGDSLPKLVGARNEQASMVRKQGFVIVRLATFERGDNIQRRNEGLFRRFALLANLLMISDEFEFKQDAIDRPGNSETVATLALPTRKIDVMRVMITAHEPENTHGIRPDKLLPSGLLPGEVTFNMLVQDVAPSQVETV